MRSQEPLCWLCGQPESTHNENLCSDLIGEHQAQKEAEPSEADESDARNEAHITIPKEKIE